MLSSILLLDETSKPASTHFLQEDRAYSNNAPYTGIPFGAIFFQNTTSLVSFHCVLQESCCQAGMANAFYPLYDLASPMTSIIF